MSKQFKVAVVGATGIAGQQFIAALAGHPWFTLSQIAASPRSAGKKYIDAISDESGKVNWYADGPLPSSVASMTVQDAKALDATSVDIVFTATESDAARELEPIYAQTTPVVSTASAFRYEDDVPLLLPGINIEHAPLLAAQKKRGWQGFVAPNPNCTTVGLAYALAPIHKQFGITRVDMVSMQAVSGAGRTPGVPSMDIIDNIVPFIPKEEGKVEVETQKILGTLAGDSIESAAFPVSCTCTRVPVLEGHTEAVHVALKKSASVDDIIGACRTFNEGLADKQLPTAPPALIVVQSDPFRPQVRLDRDTHNGLAVTVGRIRVDNSDPKRVKLMVVSHNTKLGAAAGCVLTAEELVYAGVIP